MKNIKFRRHISIILVLAVAFLMTACGNGEPGVYDAPSGASYEGLCIIDRMNSSSTYEHKKGEDHFSATMKWRTENENVDFAQYSDEFFLEWAPEETRLFVLCEPVNDMSALRNNLHNMKPDEDNTIECDISAYFNGLATGCYRVVKVLDVNYKDGTTEKMVASFEFEIN